MTDWEIYDECLGDLNEADSYIASAIDQTSGMNCEADADVYLLKAGRLLGYARNLIEGEMAMTEEADDDLE